MASDTSKLNERINRTISKNIILSNEFSIDCNDRCSICLDNIIDKNINPLTRVAMSKSIPKKCAKTFGVSVESIFEGDLVRYQWSTLKKYKGNMLIISNQVLIGHLMIF